MLKNLIKILSYMFIYLSLSSIGFAQANTNSWTCKTNASSASSGSAEEKADKSMDTPKDLKSAFMFASEHCRDCTKITCSK